MDPDNTMLPVGFRQRDQTAKEPTGELSRDKLMNFLEEEGAAVPDKEEEVAYEAGTKRGKVFKMPEKIISDNPYANETSGKVELEPEVEKGLADATESWKDNTLCKMKTDIIDESFINETDTEDVMNKIKNNDASLDDVNLNNLDLTTGQLLEVVGAMKSNSSVKYFSIANTRANDEVAKACGEMLADNKSLEVFNCETN